MTVPQFDVLTMGRVSVDLYPEQSGVSLAEVRTFAKSLGEARRTWRSPPPDSAAGPP